jgi:hypothetical protein
VILRVIHLRQTPSSSKYFVSFFFFENGELKKNEVLGGGGKVGPGVGFKAGRVVSYILAED